MISAFWRLWIGLAVGLWVTLLGGSVAYADRLAMVIGNSGYTTVPSLSNPVNDARALSTKLTELGFAVTTLTDLTHKDLEPQLGAFLARAAQAEIVLFYFSGHAFQVRGVNYLVPVDARLRSAQAIGAETWVLSDILSRLEALRTDTVVMLDACRDNPLPASSRFGQDTSGLARIESGADTKVVFATQPNMVAYEGTKDVSFFTQAILDHIDTENQSLDDLIRNVRNQVRTETVSRQVPWSGGNLSEAFYFKRKAHGRTGLTPADMENLVLNYAPEVRAEILRKLAASVDLDLTGISPQLAALEGATSLQAVIEGDRVAGGDTVQAAPILPRARPDRSDPTNPTTDADGRIYAPRVSGLSVSRTSAVALVTRTVPRDTFLPVQPVSLRLPGLEYLLTDDQRAVVPPLIAPDGTRDLAGQALARATQVELDRLGCYTDRIDGIWGRNSTYALSSYFLAKGVVFEDLNPQGPLLRQLQLEPGIVCTGVQPRAPQVVTRVVKPALAGPRPKATIAPKARDEIETGNTFIGIRVR